MIVLLLECIVCSLVTVLLFYHVFILLLTILLVLLVSEICTDIKLKV